MTTTLMPRKYTLCRSGLISTSRLPTEIFHPRSRTVGTVGRYLEAVARRHKRGLTLRISLRNFLFATGRVTIGQYQICIKDVVPPPRACEREPLQSSAGRRPREISRLPSIILQIGHSLGSPACEFFSNQQFLERPKPASGQTVTCSQ